jgi:hypothetical protein
MKQQGRWAAAVLSAALVWGTGHAAAPHVHGVGQLDVAFDAGELQIALRTPAADVVGFEHAPHTPAQRNALEQAMVRLEQGAELFAMPPAADCRLAEAQARSPHRGEPQGHEHDRHHDHGHDAASHSEVEAFYRFRCAEAPRWVDVGLFEAFPAMQRLNVQVVTTQGQGAATLGPDSPRLDLE